jgi:hypothetical protein
LGVTANLSVTTRDFLLKKSIFGCAITVDKQTTLGFLDVIKRNIEPSNVGHSGSLYRVAFVGAHSRGSLIYLTGKPRKKGIHSKNIAFAVVGC